MVVFWWHIDRERHRTGTIWGLRADRAGGQHFESGIKMSCPSPPPWLAQKRPSPRTAVHNDKGNRGLTGKIPRPTICADRQTVYRRSAQDGRTRGRQDRRRMYRRQQPTTEGPRRSYQQSGLAWLAARPTRGGKPFLLIKPLFHRYQSRLGWRQKVSLDGTPWFTCDRCHLQRPTALDNGGVRYVTAVSTSDVTDG